MAIFHAPTAVVQKREESPARERKQEFLANDGRGIGAFPTVGEDEADPLIGARPFADDRRGHGESRRYPDSRTEAKTIEKAR